MRPETTEELTRSQSERSRSAGPTWLFFPIVLLLVLLILYPFLPAHVPGPGKDPVSLVEHLMSCYLRGSYRDIHPHLVARLRSQMTAPELETKSRTESQGFLDMGGSIEAYYIHPGEVEEGVTQAKVTVLVKVRDLTQEPATPWIGKLRFFLAKEKDGWKLEEFKLVRR